MAAVSLQAVPSLLSHLSSAFWQMTAWLKLHLPPPAFVLMAHLPPLDNEELQAAVLAWHGQLWIVELLPAAFRQ